MKKRDIKIFYLHGFRGHYECGKKIKFLKNMYGGENVIGYDLYDEPLVNIKKIDKDIMENYYYQEKLFVGTSLGGYYAQVLASIFDAHSLLINPVIEPENELKKYLNTEYSSFKDETKKITITNKSLKDFEYVTNKYINKDSQSYQNNAFIKEIWIGGLDPLQSDINKIKNYFVDYTLTIFNNEVHRFNSFDVEFPKFYERILNHKFTAEFSDSIAFDWLLREDD